MGIKLPFGLPFSRAKPDKFATKSINPKNNVETVYVEKNSGLTISLDGSVTNPDSNLFTELNANLATELANVTFKSNDENLTRQLNVRPNKMDNAVKFWTEFWELTLKNGIGVIRVRDMRIIPVGKSRVIRNYEDGTIEITALVDDKEKTFLFDVDELIVVEIDIPTKSSVTQLSFVSKIKDFINSITETKIENVFKVDTDLSERERRKYQKHLDSGDKNLLIDNTFESYQALNNQSTFDQKEFDAALRIALNSRKVPLEVYNMSYTKEQYNIFYFSFLMLKLEQLEIELRQKRDDSIRVYHKSLINLTPDQLKNLGMLGAVTINEVRELHGKGPVPGGDKLIENWNEKGKKGDSKDEGKETDK